MEEWGFPLPQRLQPRHPRVLPLHQPPPLPDYLQYIVQGHRYNIFEDVGCLAETFETPVAIVLFHLPPLLVGCVSVVYCTPGQGRLFLMPINLLVACFLIASTSPPPLPAVAVPDVTGTIIARLRRLPPPPLPSPAALAISPTPVSVNFPHSGSLSSPATDWVTSIDHHFIPPSTCIKALAWFRS
ncbi:hypothetical protein B0H14DRAFT_3478098 [Mycena olivaceomarginata]|nr:hypothetical protein B0H14DRAFT_3478098 [Mycena olivaceomarginata]